MIIAKIRRITEAKNRVADVALIMCILITNNMVAGCTTTILVNYFSTITNIIAVSGIVGIVHLPGPLPLDVEDEDVVGAADNHHEHNRVVQSGLGGLDGGVICTDGDDLHHGQQAHTYQAQRGQEGLGGGAGGADKEKHYTHHRHHNSG